MVSDVRIRASTASIAQRLKQDHRALPIVVMTGHGDIPLAVEAMKLGAIDFLEKPFEDERLLNAITTALSRTADEMKNEAAAAEVAARIASLSPRERQVMEGSSPAVQQLIARGVRHHPRTIEVYRANVIPRCRPLHFGMVRLAMPADCSRIEVVQYGIGENVGKYPCIPVPAR